MHPEAIFFMFVKEISSILFVEQVLALCLAVAVGLLIFFSSCSRPAKGDMDLEV